MWSHIVPPPGNSVHPKFLFWTTIHDSKDYSHQSGPCSGASIEVFNDADNSQVLIVNLFSLIVSQVDNLVYVSGFLGTDANGTMMTGISNQTRMALENIGHVLREAQSSFANGWKDKHLMFKI